MRGGVYAGVVPLLLKGVHEGENARPGPGGQERRMFSGYR